MKQHLLKHFEESARHHLELGKVHQRLHEAHKAISGYLGDGEHADGHRDIAKAHGEAAELHADHAAHHLKMYKAIAEARDDIDTVRPSRISDRGDGGDLDGPRKAMADNPWGDRGLQKIRPDGVAGVLPDNPSLRLIPRTGGAPIPAEKDSTELLDELLK